MDELPQLDWRERELPRWVQVPAGIVLGLLTLLCGLAIVSLFFLAPKGPSTLAIVVVALLLLPCVGVLIKCIRIVTGRKLKGGVFSPTALRVVAVVMLVMPIVGLFTGYYREMGLAAVWQALIYFLGAIGLRQLARKRESQACQPQSGTQNPV